MLIKNYKHFVKILNHQYDKPQLLFSHLMKYCLHHRQHLTKHQHTPLSTSSTYSYSFITVSDVISILMLLLLLPLPSSVDAVGYSYTRFVGPVAGPEHKIYVNDAADSVSNDKTSLHYGSTLPRLDYVAKPEYEFAYGVEDADAHILHNRNEMRDGDVVKGVYSLIDPDGALRVVKYTADETNGFQAEVIRNGVSSLHGQLQNDYNHIPPSKIINNNNNNYYKPDHQPPQQHYQSNQYTHGTEKGDETNSYYPSSNAAYTPNWEQIQQINQQLSYDPHIQYQAPPQAPIIYHYNNNNNSGGGNKDGDDDVEDEDDANSNSSSSTSNDSDSDYNDNGQTQYEVHEKPNNDDDRGEEELEDDENENDNDYIKNTQIIGYKKKNHHHHHPKGDNDENDDSDGDDSNDDYDDEEEESEEFEDYNETNHKESDEYY